MKEKRNQWENLVVVPAGFLVFRAGGAGERGRWIDGGRPIEKGFRNGTYVRTSSGVVDLDLGDGFAPGWGEEEAARMVVVVVVCRGEDCADPEERGRNCLEISCSSSHLLPETNFTIAGEGRQGRRSKEL